MAFNKPPVVSNHVALIFWRLIMSHFIRLCFLIKRVLLNTQSESNIICSFIKNPDIYIYFFNDWCLIVKPLYFSHLVFLIAYIITTMTGMSSPLFNYWMELLRQSRGLFVGIRYVRWVRVCGSQLWLWWTFVISITMFTKQENCALLWDLLFSFMAY